MADFGSGVKGYITGVAAVRVNFPVDWHDKADVSCSQCPFYGRTSKTCQLNKQIVHYPEKYIGVCCPLEFESNEEV